MELAILVTGEGHIAKLPFQFKVKTEFHYNIWPFISQQL